MKMSLGVCVIYDKKGMMARVEREREKEDKSLIGGVRKDGEWRRA